MASNTSSSADSDTTLLRSGKTFPKVGASMTSKPATGSPSTASTSGTQSHTYLRLLPNTSKVKPFTGTDTSHSVRNFVKDVENVIESTHVTDGKEKVAFFRSQVEPSSFAHTLLDSCTLTVPAEDGDYETFKKVFIETFDEVSGDNIVKGLHHVTQQFQSSAAAFNRLESLVTATKLSEELEKLLVNGGWFDGDNLKKPYLRKFLQLFTYIQGLQANERSCLLTLDFDPAKDDLHTFSQRIKTKMEEQDIKASRTISKIGALSLSAISKEEQPSTVGAVTPSTSTSSSVTGKCFNCGGEGHFANACPKEKQQHTSYHPRAAPHKPFGMSGPKTYTSQRGNFQGRVSNRYHGKPAKPFHKAPHFRQAYPPRRLYCSYHDSNTHNTDDCVAFQQAHYHRPQDNYHRPQEYYHRPQEHYYRQPAHFHRPPYKRSRSGQRQHPTTGSSSGEGPRTASNQPG